MLQSWPYSVQFLRWLLLALGASLFLGACASPDRAAGGQVEEQVSERVRQRWDFMAKGQAEKAYEFLSPASRSTVSLDVYRKRMAGARWWRTMTMEKVDCRADACQVTMLVEYDLHELKGLKRTIEETWVRDEGVWWLVAGK